MNPIERLREDFATRFPGIAAEVDAPADEESGPSSRTARSEN